MKLRYRYKTTPWSHQKKALSRLLKLHGRGGLFMDMATGKSKVAVDYVGLGFYNWGVRRVLIVCPKNVAATQVWPGQLEKHAPYPWKVLTLGGSTDLRLRTLRHYEFDPNIVEFVVVNYESIWRSVGNRRMPDMLTRCQFDVVIYDEAHRLKTATSRQSKAAAIISSGVKERLLLTGTPEAKNTLDFYGEFRAMNPIPGYRGPVPEQFPTSWTEFSHKYARWGGRSGYQIIKLLRVDEISRIVRKHSYRVLKKDCLDLPPKLSLFVPVTLSPKSQKLYEQMAKESIIKIESGEVSTAPIALTRTLRLQQITSGFTKDENKVEHTLGTEKLDVCMELIDDILEGDQKIIVYARFLHDVRSVAQALTSRKVQYRILSGSVPPESRDSIVRDFTEDPKVRVFVAQIESGSEGIDLTAGSVVIYFSLTDKAHLYWQSRDRPHRPGQTRKVTYYHLIVPKTVDAVQLASLKSKETLAHAVLHNPRLLVTQDIPNLSLDD